MNDNINEIKKREGLGITQPYTSIELKDVGEINVLWNFNIIERMPDGNQELLLETNKIFNISMKYILDNNTNRGDELIRFIIEKLIDYLRINSKKELGYTFTDKGLIRIRNLFDDELFENGLLKLNIYFDKFYTINNLLDIDITFEIDCI